MASTTKNRPRPATDPNRWRQVTGGRGIRRQPQKSNLQKAMGMLPIGKKATPTGSRKGTAGKAAMLTAAAGMAYKLYSKRRGEQHPTSKVG
jgi:hypothetical protein